MRRIDIIVEGPTEMTFVKEVLAPYITEKLNNNCSVYPIPIHVGQSGGSGGFVNYMHLKNDINNSLNSKDTDLVVTTFVDYFRIPQKHMPELDLWKDEQNHHLQVQMMEESIARDINDRRFVPYIQMHEFEALLFSSKQGFATYWNERQVEKVQRIIETFACPEDINTSPTGAPSKRLLAINPSYNKVIDGNIVALEVGIETILKACPKFRMWVEKLINM
ncbi:MAG: DUF4276 family protein [Paludibacteraceae bacterium]|nr:DUF4276 family protein [Paludibacteraceae bacterium]